MQHQKSLHPICCGETLADSFRISKFDGPFFSPPILINHLTGLAEPKTTAVQLSAGDPAVHIKASTVTLNKDVNFRCLRGSLR